MQFFLAAQDCQDLFLDKRCEARGVWQIRDVLVQGRCRSGLVKAPNLKVENHEQKGASRESWTSTRD